MRLFWNLQDPPRWFHQAALVFPGHIGCSRSYIWRTFNRRCRLQSCTGSGSLEVIKIISRPRQGISNPKWATIVHTRLLLEKQSTKLSSNLTHTYSKRHAYLTYKGTLNIILKNIKKQLKLPTLANIYCTLHVLLITTQTQTAVMAGNWTTLYMTASLTRINYNNQFLLA